MRYTVVLRATSYVTFKLHEALNVPLDGEHGRANVRLMTCYADFGLESPLPEHLVAVVEGEHADLKDAVIEASILANRILPVVAFAGNGQIGEAHYQFGYDASPNAQRRRFIQFVTPHMESAMASNLIDLYTLGNVLTAVAESRHRPALYTAMTQYGLALREWTPGYQTAAVSHLFMAMEALTGCGKTAVFPQARPLSDFSGTLDLVSLLGFPLIVRANVRLLDRPVP
jgi:hypothetical protein